MSNNLGAPRLHTFWRITGGGLETLGEPQPVKGIVYPKIPHVAFIEDVPYNIGDSVFPSERACLMRLAEKAIGFRRHYAELADSYFDRIRDLDEQERRRSAS